MADYRAIRPIDFPLHSGIWAYGVGDSVPEANVKAYGYDDPDDCYVEQAGTQVTDAAGPASEAQAETDKA